MIHPSAVTILVTRRIKHGCGSEFEHLMQSMMLVASDFPGHLGGQLVKPSLEEPGLYHVVFAFDSDAHLQNWQTSPARSLGLAAIEPLTEGTCTNSSNDRHGTLVHDRPKPFTTSAMESGCRHLDGHLPHGFDVIHSFR